MISVPFMQPEQTLCYTYLIDNEPYTAIVLCSPTFFCVFVSVFFLCLCCFQGFTMLMDANRINDLSRMYNLFQRVNAVELLKLALSAYIRATGQGIIMDEEKDKELVPFLLEFKASLDKILEESFAKNEAFSNTIKDSFEHLINLRQVCDLFSLYLTISVLHFCLSLLPM